MKFFVAGASGYTGQAVVRLGLRSKHSVIAHFRPDSPRLDDLEPTFRRLGAEVAICPWEEEALTEVFLKRKPNVVFCVIGTTSKRKRQAKAAGRSETYENVDHDLSILLMRAAVRSGLRPRFVYLSAVGASEKSHLAYMRVRHRVEVALAESKLPHIIVRPSFITGPDRDEKRSAEPMTAAVLNGALAVAKAFGAKALAAKYRSLTADQLAAAMIHAVEHATADRLVLEGEALHAAI